MTRRWKIDADYKYKDSNFTNYDLDLGEYVNLNKIRELEKQLAQTNISAFTKPKKDYEVLITETENQIIRKKQNINFYIINSTGFDKWEFREQKEKRRELENAQEE